MEILIPIQLVPLSKQTDMSEREIERWWRLRRAQDKPSTLVKFCENTWRCIYYLYSFIFGVIVLWDKPWFWDVKSCWYGYPHQVRISMDSTLVSMVLYIQFNAYSNACSRSAMISGGTT